MAEKKEENLLQCFIKLILSTALMCAELFIQFLGRLFFVMGGATFIGWDLPLWVAVALVLVTLFVKSGMGFVTAFKKISRGNKND